MAAVRHDSTSWTFLTNHSHVLLCLVRNSSMRMRDIAIEVGITERAVQRIIVDLDAAGYIQRKREGRHNIYSISTDANLRHPIERHKTVGDLIDLVLGSQTKKSKQK